MQVPMPTLTTRRWSCGRTRWMMRRGFSSWPAHFEIADTTLNIPHPYRTASRRSGSAAGPRQWSEGKVLDLAVTLPGTGIIGGIGLMRYSPRHRHAELGYWIGKEFWGAGTAPRRPGRCCGSVSSSWTSTAFSLIT